MNLQHLSQFLENEIYLIPGEKHAHKRGMIQSEPQVESPSGALDAPEEVPALEFEGGFEKAILVVHEEVGLKPELREMLFNLFGALQCSLKDIALVDSNQLEALPMETVIALNPSKVIVFGLVRHDLMAIQKNKYEIVQEDGVEYLFADALTIIAENKDLKRKLWKEIQVFFNINK